jgi:hypothetical protein
MTNKYRDDTVVSGLTNRKAPNYFHYFFLIVISFLAGWLIGQYNSYKFLNNYNWEITKDCKEAADSIHNSAPFDFSSLVIAIVVFVIIWIIGSLKWAEIFSKRAR